MIYLAKLKISRRQIKTSQSLDIPVLEIAKLIIAKLSYLKKIPNTIAAKYFPFTVICIDFDPWLCILVQ